MQYELLVMPVFYYLSSCSTCKKILKTLPLTANIKQVDIKKTPLDESQIEQLYKLSGSYEALFSRRAQLYKKRHLKDHKLSETQYRQLLLEHYSFLKRPILYYDKRIFIGNSPVIVAAANAFLNEH